MKTVYLDQNKWIDLSRAHHGDPLGAPFQAVLSAASLAVSDGTASFPLSAGHYFETWKQRKGDPRRALAEVMSNLSQHRTIGDQRSITIAEIDEALRQEFGAPEVPRTVEPFGYGAAHAFGRPELADYRQLAATDPRFAGLDEAIADVFERETLSGPTEDLPVAGIAQPNLEAAIDYATSQNELAAGFAAHNTSRGEQERTIAALELSSLLHLIMPALVRAGITEDAFFALGPEGLTRLILLMPWRGAGLTLSQRRHRDTDQAWTPNDLNDIAYLTLGLTYCDILVTERQWVHRIRAAHLDERCDTVVIADVGELPEHL